MIFSGYKTYILTAAAAIILVLGALKIIDLQIAVEIAGLLGLGSVAALRAGVAKASK